MGDSDAEKKRMMSLKGETVGKALAVVLEGCKAE